MPQTIFSCQTCLSVATWSAGLANHDPTRPNIALTFAGLRRALIASLPLQMANESTPLTTWRPNEDLGLLVLESWAYVGDVLHFYNGVVKSESFLPTASQSRSLRRICNLVGHQSRPPVGTQAEIAALVDSGTARLPSTAYRASVPDSVPQTFEAEPAPSVSHKFNEYTIAPVRVNEAAHGEKGVYLLDPTSAAPVRGRPVAFIWFDSKVINASATEIVSVESVTLTDGRDYVVIRVEPGFNLAFGDTILEDVAIQSPSQRAYPCTSMFKLGHDPIKDKKEELDLTNEHVKNAVNQLPGGGKGTSAKKIDVLAFADKSQSEIWLDSVYRSISAGDLLVLQSGPKFFVHRVVGTEENAIKLAGTDPNSDGPKLPVTKLTVNPKVNGEFVNLGNPRSLVIHYNLHDIGRMTRVARTELTADVVVGSELSLEGIHDPPTNPPTEFILEDANGRGVLVEGELKVDATGAATLKVTSGKWDGGLRVPVKAYGNVVRVTRGETVAEEVLGDGDASQAHQTFKLARSPLTYLPAPGTPRGIASTLEVRVDGVLWHERSSFYGAGPNDAVYIVRHDDDQNTFITFGDGVRGMRVPTGRRNVRASYRHGAGAAAPPPGAINQVVKGPPGLRVRSPIPAYGGADAESARDIRKNAPASALVLGRCVSLADFAARVAGLPGIRNSKVEYTWDEASLTAGVKVWYVPNTPGDDLNDEIVADLQAMCEPGLVIRAAAATPIGELIGVDVEIDRDYQPADIEAAVHAALLDPDKGLLAPNNTPIGGPLSRSALVAVARSIPGVLDVLDVHYGLQAGPDTFPPPGLLLGAGEYFDFDGVRAGNLVVGAYFAESRGCRDFVS